MSGSIVVGVDDSESAAGAARVARELGARLGLRLVFVRVVGPGDDLVAAAKDESATLIVVGSTGPRSSPPGSVSADVSRRAPCPVVVVAPDADRSLTHRGPTFPGLLEDGHEAVARGPELSGGIVRFDLEAGRT